jgi:hypothetical protein
MLEYPHPLPQYHYQQRPEYHVPHQLRSLRYCFKIKFNLTFLTSKYVTSTPARALITNSKHKVKNINFLSAFRNVVLKIINLNFPIWSHF